MSDFVGKICPFCKTEISENDEVVVCSNCDMPHHKDCWIENQGCTTFGCMGTIKTADGAPSVVTTTEISFEEAQPQVRFCTRCGAQGVVGAAFCSKCGNSLREIAAPAYQQTSVSPQPTYQQNVYSAPNQNGYAQTATLDPEVAVMVGVKREYYVSKFMEMKTQNKQISWNWPAFFFTPYWFIYRKMYGYGFAALAVSFFMLLVNNPVISFLALGGYIAVGLFANYIYMQWVEKNVRQAQLLSEPFKTQYIQKNSGVSSLALVLTIIGYAVLSGLASV